MLDWNDLRIFLAVARNGSALAAARQLNLNQTTVGRRIEALEHALGATLFFRTTRGTVLSPDATKLFPYAEAVEAAAEKLEGEAGRQRRALSGEIRVTAPEILMSQFVSPLTLRFGEMHPDIRFDYVSAEHRLDLTKSEADIAFRADRGVDEDTLVRVPLPDIAWSFYCSGLYAQNFGIPKVPAELGAHRVVAYTGSIARLPVSDFLMANVSAGNIVATSNSVPNMAGTLKAGHGVGMLPCLYGDDFDGLARCFDPPPGLISRWWIVASAESYKIPGVHAFMSFAAVEIRTRRVMLAGLRLPNPADNQV